MELTQEQIAGLKSIQEELAKRQANSSAYDSTGKLITSSNTATPTTTTKTSTSAPTSTNSNASDTYVDPRTGNTYPSYSWMISNINNLPEVKKAYPELAGSDIVASQIKSSVPEIKTTTGTTTNTNANAISAYTDAEQARIDAEQAKLTSAIGGSTTNTTAENLATYAGTRPTIDTETKLASKLSESGATALSSQLQLENTKLATLKGEIEQINADEQNELNAASNRLASGTSIANEKEVISNKYASKIAKKNAEYSSQAATVAAIQGNYQIAYNAAKDAVNAYTYDYQQNVKTFDTLFSVYSDALKDLDTEEQNILKVAAQNAQDELDKATKEKTEVSNLMISYPRAGITISDTYDQAVIKAAEYEKENKKTANLKYITDDSGNVNVYDDSSGTPVFVKSLGQVGQGNPQIAVAGNAANASYLANKGIATTDPDKVYYENYYKMYNEFKANGGGSLENFYSLFPMTSYMDSWNISAWNNFVSSNKLDKSNSSINLDEII